ncbi:putative transposase/invertase (TIGR01784 family) [Anoxybacillus tengchongensis]|uniref:Putative transposase/invertase (TIGR01784 family) n=1 Tax=Anoxybacillus tengchongensis TaxID=576944 RepID=A0A7W9YS08_9BACL|nr:putative transposase/invertase (TIGR01784 family) [Anoxybacillus tengchongensis]
MRSLSFSFSRRYNPIAAALLSKMGYTESERVEWKKQFLRMLVRMELDEAKQRLLFGFFETYVKRSDEEERRLRSEVNEMETKEKEQVLELMISYEQKALEKGREEGMKQGIKQGMIQGMKHLVQTMKRKGMSVKDIANVTDLEEEEIQKLLEKE